MLSESGEVFRYGLHGAVLCLLRCLVRTQVELDGALSDARSCRIALRELHESYLELRHSLTTAPP
jgi:hypothetical protein